MFPFPILGPGISGAAVWPLQAGDGSGQPGHINPYLLNNC